MAVSSKTQDMLTDLTVLLTSPEKLEHRPGAREAEGTAADCVRKILETN